MVLSLVIIVLFVVILARDNNGANRGVKATMPRLQMIRKKKVGKANASAKAAAATDPRWPRPQPAAAAEPSSASASAPQKAAGRDARSAGCAERDASGERCGKSAKVGSSAGGWYCGLHGKLHGPFANQCCHAESERCAARGEVRDPATGHLYCKACATLIGLRDSANILSPLSAVRVGLCASTEPEQCRTQAEKNVGGMRYCKRHALLRAGKKVRRPRSGQLTPLRAPPARRRLDGKQRPASRSQRRALCAQPDCQAHAQKAVDDLVYCKLHARSAKTPRGGPVEDSSQEEMPSWEVAARLEFETLMAGSGSSSGSESA